MNNEVTEQDDILTFKEQEAQELAYRFYQAVWENSHEKMEERGNINED